MNPRRLRCCVLAVFASALAVRAQCPNPSAWSPGGECPAPDGTVSAMVKWDPDGPGPLGVHAVCGGEFRNAGTVATANVALYDPVARTWSALGAGFDRPVRALTVLANGDLIAGGEFEHSAATPMSRVARWTGSAWVRLGQGIDGDVLAMVSLPSGDLVAGGTFGTAGGVAALNVARWNGTSWSALGAGVSGVAYPSPPWFEKARVKCLGVRSNGDLIVGGAFTHAGGVAVNSLARWDGVSWSSLGFGSSGVDFATMAVLANGDVLVSSWAPWGGQQPPIVRWDGTSWSTMGSWPSPSFEYPIAALCETANGTVLAAYRAPSTGLLLIEWNGTGWAWISSTVSIGPTAILELAAQDVLMAGSIPYRDNVSVWRWSGGVWRAPAAGLVGWVADVETFGDKIVIGGSFTQVANVPAQGVAVRVNGVWSALGGGVDGHVNVVERAANGDVIVGGSFTQAGSVAVNNLARWDGSQWHAMGNHYPGVLAIAALPDGEVAVSSDYGIFRSIGTSWLQIAIFPATALAVLPNGDLVAAKRTGTTSVVRRSGTTWSLLGSGLYSPYPGDRINALRVLPNGDLVAARSSSWPSPPVPPFIARWDGTSWSQIGQGLPSGATDIDVLPNGDLLVAHSLRDPMGQPTASPSRWNGVVWTPLPGIEAGPSQDVSCLAVVDSGEVFAAGSFGSVHGTAAGGLASLITGCPAAAAPAGAGCSGSAGAVTLSMQSLPWLGGSYRARTTGLPAPSRALQVFGFSSVLVPLGSLLPQGLPGCSLHVSPDVLGVDLPVAGAVTTVLAIPSAASLIGQSFRHQVVVLQLSGTGAITAASSSNALLLTIGAW